MKQVKSGGLHGRRFFMGATLGLLATCPPLWAAGDAKYLVELQAQAKEQKLAADPGWLRLMHYEPRSLNSGWKSAVTDRGFFAAANGVHEPDEELAAALALFFSDQMRDDEPTQCRLRARYGWLKKKLAFDATRLPEQPCTRFDAWRAGLDVQQLALVFASADLDAPSTLFGHTLLRLDARGQAQSERLLAYAVNYAALVGPDAGMLYALRGLGGGYDGYFGLFPYYEKVKEYVRIEYRDLWEYPLALSEDDSARLLEHLWELRGIGIAYYFLSRNCSYQLLSALEAVRPDLHLTPRFRSFPPYAIPLDTLRQLQDQGLLGKPTYRPSLSRQLLARYAQLPPPLQDWTRDYAGERAALEDTRLSQAPPQDQAHALELAHELLYFRFRSDQLDRDRGLPLARAALLQRSRIPLPSAAATAPLPAQPPEASHLSGRTSVGLRRTDDDRARALVSIRPAYHDRLDPSHHYLAAGEIQFLSLDFAADDERLQIDHARILAIEAIAIRDALFRPWSWFVDTGLRRTHPHSFEPGRLGAYFDGGRGLAWGLGDHAQVFGLAQISFDANRELDRGRDLAAGARLGLSGQLAGAFGAELRASWLQGVGDAARDRRNAGVGLQYSWHARNGLRLTWQLERTESEGIVHTAQSVDVRWLHYF
ncbi:MAG: lipoprotein N-acyltransferase Lnb domain-containing protein [Panacagrimonas sp.]